MKSLRCGIGFLIFLVTSLLQGGETIPFCILEERLICDLRMLANKSFSPLEGFMKEKDYISVLNCSRLEDGTLFPLPIVLPIALDQIDAIKNAGKVLLKNRLGHSLAIVDVEDIYIPDLERECLSSFGTIDLNHPGVSLIRARKNCCYIGGKIHPFSYLKEIDFEEGVLSPDQTKELFRKNSWEKVVAFQTRNPLHRAHVALIQRSLDEAGEDAVLFLHPVIGPTQDEDVSPLVRKRCYEAVRSYLNQTPLHIGYLPLAMRMAGPKEALLHAIIRKNYGATHFIVGRDHSGPSVKNSSGNSFYEPYAAIDLVKSYASELGLHVLASEEMVYVEETGQYVPESTVKSEQTVKRISGTLARERMQMGLGLPDWFSFPEVVKILTQYYMKKNGLCIYLTGLPCSGKSTLANFLKKRIEEIDVLEREVLVLDADVLRSYIASELGFSKKDRSINVQRIGYVASLVVESGGICVVANIAPYEEDRLINRKLINSKGCYFEVFVDTPLEVCEERDVKGLYKLAREGKIQSYTGISDPYEKPLHPNVIVNGAEDISNCLDQIMKELKKSYPLYKNIKPQLVN
jgi:sulfate adenylyltransferase